MNEIFSSPSSPAKARLLVEMGSLASLVLHESIHALAQQDCISEKVFEQHGLADPLDRKATQFIIDMNFRCGLPAMSTEQDRARRAIKAAVAIGEVGDIYIEPIQGATYETLHQHRRKLLITSIDTLTDDQDVELAAKLFPKIIAVGTMAKQFVYTLGSKKTVTSRMGSFLYPNIDQTFIDDNWNRSSPKALFATGIFPHYIY